MDGAVGAVGGVGVGVAAAGVSAGGTNPNTNVDSSSAGAQSNSYSVNISENARMAAANAAEAAGNGDNLQGMSASDDPSKNVKIDLGFNPKKQQDEASSLGSAMASYAAISSLMM